ncbi:MAG: hypothetical protein AAF198_01985 [Pseudomonadota bacterium]
MSLTPKLLECIGKLGIWFAIASPVFGAERDFYIVNFEEWGQSRTEYSGQHPTSNVYLEENSWSLIGPIETQVALDLVNQTELAPWYQGQFGEDWNTRSSILWNKIEIQKSRISKLKVQRNSVGVLDRIKRRQLNQQIEALEKTINEAERAYDVISNLQEVADAIDAVLSELKEYKFSDGEAFVGFHGAAWSTNSLETDEYGANFYEMEAYANAYNLTEEQAENRSASFRNFRDTVRLYSLKADQETLAPVHLALINWPKLHKEIALESSENWAQDGASSELLRSDVYWFQTNMDFALQSVAHAFFSLSDAKQKGPATLEFAIGSDDFSTPILEQLQIPTFEFEQNAVAQNTSVASPFNPPILDMRSNPVLLPTFHDLVMLRLDVNWSPHADAFWAVEGDFVQRGTAGSSSLSIDGEYSVWSEVGIEPSPMFQWLNTGIEWERSQSNPQLLPNAWLEGSLPLDPFISLRSTSSDGLIEVSVTGKAETVPLALGQSLKTKLTLSVFPGETPPPAKRDEMDLRLTRLYNSDYSPLPTVISYQAGNRTYPVAISQGWGDHFFVEGLLEEPAERDFYIVDMDVDGLLRERLILSPSEENPKIVRSEMQYFIWESQPIEYR